MRLRLFEILKRRVIKSSSVFMTFASSDYRLAQEWYGAKGKQFDCLYPSNAEIDLLDDLKEKGCASDKIKILLGNSATNTNQHFQMLDILKKFSDENIEILCPLSYGNLEYGKQVEKIRKKAVW